MFGIGNEERNWRDGLMQNEKELTTDVHGNARIEELDRAAMVKCLAELQAAVPWAPRSVPVQGSWEVLQRVAEILAELKLPEVAP